MNLNLRQIRRLREKTQADMATALNIHVQTYRKLEKYPELATIEQAKKISEYLDAPYNEIFFACNFYQKSNIQ